MNRKDELQKMARITQKDIEFLLKWINSNSKHQYGIDRAYGGYMLVQYVNDYDVCREISPRVEGRQLYNTLCSIQNYIIAEAGTRN